MGGGEVVNPKGIKSVDDLDPDFQYEQKNITPVE